MIRLSDMCSRLGLIKTIFPGQKERNIFQLKDANNDTNFLVNNYLKVIISIRTDTTFHRIVGRPLRIHENTHTERQVKQVLLPGLKCVMSSHCTDCVIAYHLPSKCISIKQYESNQHRITNTFSQRRGGAATLVPICSYSLYPFSSPSVKQRFVCLRMRVG